MRLHVVSLHDLNFDSNVLAHNGKEQDASYKEERSDQGRFQENHSAIA